MPFFIFSLVTLLSFLAGLLSFNFQQPCLTLSTYLISPSSLFPSFLPVWSWTTTSSPLPLEMMTVHGSFNSPLSRCNYQSLHKLWLSHAWLDLKPRVSPLFSLTFNRARTALLKLPSSKFLPARDVMPTRRLQPGECCGWAVIPRSDDKPEFELDTYRVLWDRFWSHWKVQTSVCNLSLYFSKIDLDEIKILLVYTASPLDCPGNKVWLP